jgi:Protein of unknown function (DUF4197)
MKSFLLSILLFTCIGFASAQKKINVDSLKKRSNKPLSEFLGGSTNKSLTQDEVVAGLKEALTIGSEIASKNLSMADGYFGNAVVKILMPPEAKKVEQKLRQLGMGKQVDKAILSMNRAAEDAAKSAAPIFAQAVKEMTITDAMGILKGGDNAATTYLKNKTQVPLTEAFRPVIDTSLKKTDATRYWKDVFDVYNKFSMEKVNPDLTAYVTEKALAGLFLQLAEEEKKIRKDPMAQTTQLLKKVFGGSK